MDSSKELNIQRDNLINQVELVQILVGLNKVNFT